MRDAWGRPFLLVVALVAVAGALGALWVPWLGAEHGECGWTCYVPLASGTARPSFEELGGPAGRFVAPVGVALTIVSCALALACVVAAGRSAARRTVLALAVTALAVSAGSVVVSIASAAIRLHPDVVVFASRRFPGNVASGGLGPGIFLAVACAVAAGSVAGVVARRRMRVVAPAAPAHG